MGAATILVVGFDAVTFAATGSSLLLGRVNQANAVTTVQNTGAGAALNLVTKSTASPPLTTNAKGLVPNLFAGRAANADRVGGLTVAQVRAGSIPPAGRTHLVGQSGEPAFGAFTNGFSPIGLDNYGAGFPPVSFRKDQLGVVHIGGLLCITDGGVCYSKVVASAAFETLFTLPPGYRPAAETIFVVADSDRFGRVDVKPNGEVVFETGPSVLYTFISLDGISFVATH